MYLKAPQNNQPKEERAINLLCGKNGAVFTKMALQSKCDE